MVKYLVAIFFFAITGCEMHSKQIIKLERFDYDIIKFNTVTKNLILNEAEINADDYKNLEKIISYWFDNKVKTDGFEGNLEIIFTDMNSTTTKKEDYYKFSINLIVEFTEKNMQGKSSNQFKVQASEYSEISGNFSISDRENLRLNVMHQALESITSKILEIN